MFDFLDALRFVVRNTSESWKGDRTSEKDKLANSRFLLDNFLRKTLDFVVVKTNHKPRRIYVSELPYGNNAPGANFASFPFAIAQWREVFVTLWHFERKLKTHLIIKRLAATCLWFFYLSRVVFSDNFVGYKEAITNYLF